MKVVEVTENAVIMAYNRLEQRPVEQHAHQELIRLGDERFGGSRDVGGGQEGIRPCIRIIRVYLPTST